MSDITLLAVPVDLRIALSRILFSYHVVVQLDSGDLTGLGGGVLYRCMPHRVGRLFRREILPWWQRACQDQVSADWPERAREWARISPAAVYAVDTAVWDLRSQMENRSLCALLGGAQRSSVGLTEQVFIRDWSVGEAELADILARGTKRIKVKIGIDPATDLQTIERVRAFVGMEVDLRVDANHAYSLAEGESLYRRLADLGVTAFEEPLRVGDWRGLRTLRERVGMPVILDESVLSIEDLRTAIAERALDVLNVKLTRVGGITLAREYIRLCQQGGIGVVIGCTEDLGMGMAAIVHTAGSLDTLHSVEGVGPLRLGFDVATPAWEIQDGALKVPTAPGLGVTLQRDWLARVPGRVKRFDLAEDRASLWVFSRYSRFRQRAENARVRIARRLA